jgi:hypothetical protein
MVRAEKDMLIIEIETSVPDSILFDLLCDMPSLIKALQCLDEDYQDPNVPAGIATLLTLYKAILPMKSKLEKCSSRRTRNETNNYIELGT